MGLANYQEQVVCLKRLETARCSLGEGQSMLKQARQLMDGWAANMDSITFQDFLTGLHANQLGEVQHNLIGFIRDAGMVLDRMNDLEKTGFSVGLMRFHYLAYARFPAEKPIIRVDTRVLAEAAKLMGNAGARIQQAQDQARMVDGRLDPLLLDQQDLRKRLSSIHLGIDQLLRVIKTAIHRLQQIVQIYEATERRIKQKADAIQIISSPGLGEVIVGPFDPRIIIHPPIKPPEIRLKEILESSFGDNAN